jgi:hypothetical protein
VTANRRFLVRAVRFLCGAGIGQFLDIGTGFPAGVRREREHGICGGPGLAGQ